MYYLRQLFHWSEVWALLIPLAVWLRHRKQPWALQPVVWYLWLGFAINLVVDVAWKAEVYFKGANLLPQWLADNNFLYNVHSIVRFACFSLFFIRLKQPLLTTLKRVIPVLAGLLTVLNFYYFEAFVAKNTFSSRLLAAEAGLLLFYCLQYYLFSLQQPPDAGKRPGHFWIVVGLSIYVVVNFFIFLLYTSLMPDTQIFLWNVHNIAFIVFCIFMAKGIYAYRHH